MSPIYDLFQKLSNNNYNSNMCNYNCHQPNYVYLNCSSNYTSENTVNRVSRNHVRTENNCTVYNVGNCNINTKK